LTELVPELRHPVNQRRIRELLSATNAQAVRKVAFRPEVPEF
jgi:hypothetical protein